MAASQAAYGVEKAVGHDGNPVIEQDVSDYKKTSDDHKTMKALVWQGKNKVEIGKPQPLSSSHQRGPAQPTHLLPVDTPKPKLLEPRDVILKITGTTICGSDLHLLDGTILQLEKGDILGHVRNTRHAPLPNPT